MTFPTEMKLIVSYVLLQSPWNIPSAHTLDLKARDKVQRSLLLMTSRDQRESARDLCKIAKI